MSYNFNNETTKTTLTRRLFAAAIALGCAFAPAAYAQENKIKPPTTSSTITPREGNSPFFVGHALGTQGYICLPTSAGASTASWTVKGPRPEATLFRSFFGQNFQVITHFLSPDTNPTEDAPKPLPFGSPTWQSSLDSSKVWAQAVQSIPAGSDPSGCPNGGAIACVLLEAIGSQTGPTGGALLTQTTFIQRLNTKGGSAPSDGCSVSGDVGNQVLVPYTADYYFYRKSE